MTPMGRFLPFAAFWADSLHCTTMLQCDRPGSAKSGQSPVEGLQIIGARLELY